MQVPDWLLVEVALLLIGLTKISKSGFDHLFVIESPLRLRALAEKITRATQGSLPLFGSEFTIQRRLCLCFLLHVHILLLWSGGRCQMCPTVHIYIQLPFPCIRYIFSIFPIPHFFNHRVDRVAMAIFWRTFHHEGKFSPGW